MILLTGNFFLKMVALKFRSTKWSRESFQLPELNIMFSLYRSRLLKLKQPCPYDISPEAGIETTDCLLNLQLNRRTFLFPPVFFADCVTLDVPVHQQLKIF